jgi:exoribonuclease-2
MERFWCLQYLIQEQIEEVHATVWRENIVKIDFPPYMTKVYGLPELKAGTRVSLKVQEVDTLMMELRTKFISVLEEAVAELAIDEDEVFLEEPPVAQPALESVTVEDTLPAEANQGVLS